MTDNEIIKALECFALDRDFDDSQCIGCAFEHQFCTANMSVDIARPALALINRQKADIERLTKENDELKNGFFQEHYKEIECQELLSVKEAWRKESLHNIDLEAEIERLNGYINTNCLGCAGCTQWKCDCSNIKAEI